MKVSAQRDTHLRQDGRGRVRITIRHGKTLVRHPLDIYVKPRDWNLSTKRVKMGEPLQHVYNRAIEKALDRARTMIVERPGISPEELRDALGRQEIGGLSISSALAAAVKDHAFRFRPGTLECFDHVVRLVGEALPEVSLTALSPAHVHRYREHVSGKLHQNTIRRLLKHFRLLYSLACSTHDLEPRNVFKGVIPRELPTAPRFLSPVEVERFRALDPKLPELSLTRDAWILQLCLGGMRVGDVLTLRPEQYQDGWIEYRMGKTGQVRWIPVIAQARDIIERYRGGKFVLPLCKSDDRKDIKAAVSLLNVRLKMLAIMSGANPRLSTHWSRHTCATWLEYLKVDRRVIQMILGHGSFKTTEVYLEKFSRDSVKEAMGKLETALG